MASSTIDLRPLIEVLPPGAVVTDPIAMDDYRMDRARDPGARLPLAVVKAHSTEDVQAAVRFAAQRGVGVIPRGAGSGLSGGSSAQEGAIVIAMGLMREIIVDPVTRTVVAQAGAYNADVKAAARAHGLWYPPDPASFEFCSIGGNVATNAGGLCCVKYGVTTDYVLGMTVVLADGTAVTLGGERLKDVAGLALTKLFVGSEGTLGVITEVVLRLIPAQRPPTTLVATFDRLERATQAVLAITQKVRPSMLEFMDRASIDAVERVAPMGLSSGTEAMLIVQSDEPGPTAIAEIDVVAEICNAHHAIAVSTTSDPEESERLIAARRMAIPAVERTGTLLLADVGVPIPRLEDLVLGIQRISQRQQLTIAVIAHAGDGNTHPLLVFDPADADQEVRAALAYRELMELAMQLGGTITGEHGVGRLKKEYLPDYLGDAAMALNRRIKVALDPNNILNPGSVF